MDEKGFRLPLLLNLLIAVLGFTLLARIFHFSAESLDGGQTFALGFSLGLILSGSVILQVRPQRMILGFLLGTAGVLAFAIALFGP